MSTNFYKPSLILFISTIFLFLINSSISSTVCPLFRCSPEIVALDYYSINSTLDIKCIFLNRIEDPSDIMWKFQLNRAERIINDLDGGILPPFKHIIKNTNLTHGFMMQGASGSQSILRIPLLNSSYFTNYTIMHTRDSCQQTIRVNLKETAMGYSSAYALSSSRFVHRLTAALFTVAYFLFS